MANPKRIKLEDDTVYTNTTMYTVLSDDLLEAVPYMDVYVDTIIDPKTTSKVVVNLNSCLPIQELTHLKRVKGREIILFPVGDTEMEKVHGVLQNKNFDTSLLQNAVRVVSVAKVPPKTKKQFTEVQKYWPCNFHSDKYIEKLATNTLFTSSEVLEHEKYMIMAIKVAEHCRKLGITHKNTGVVIVDPKIKSVVAVGYSDAHHNPCRHAPMVAIDQVAKTQNGSTTYNSPDPAVLNQCGIPSSILLMLNQAFPDATFGATWFKGKSDSNEPSDGPYLCTSYYVYVTHEPCVMCAMAFVHSRVNRVFYGQKSLNGALGTLCKIHTLKDLNHHYEAFAGLCEDKCSFSDL